MIVIVYLRTGGGGEKAAGVEALLRLNGDDTGRTTLFSTSRETRSGKGEASEENVLIFTV